MAFWMVRAGRRGEREDFALEKGMAAAGFSHVPDLTGAKDKDAVLEIIETANPDFIHMKAMNHAAQLNMIANRMKKGDHIILPLKNRPQVAIGKITGDYKYIPENVNAQHTIPVKWIKTDIPRNVIGQDLLYSINSSLTICQISRNNAEQRFLNILKGGKDVGQADGIGTETSEEIITSEEPRDVERIAKDQLAQFINRNFHGHEMSRLVDEVLKAEGYVTEFSPPGPDGGVDVLARKGTLGFDGVKLCVQVKSSASSADVTIFRGLQGTMATFNADHGLLVCWGGFNRAVLREARLSFFNIRLWDSDNLIDAIVENYDNLSEELQKELPLKRVWALVQDE